MPRRFTLQRSLAPALAGILMISALPASAQQQGNSNAASASSTPTSCEDAVAQQVRKQCPREASRVCAEAVRKAVAQSCSPQQQVRNQQLAQQTSQVPSPETAGTGAGETGLAAGAVEATVLGAVNKKGAGEFTLTSPAFTEGGAIPVDNSCYGANESPQLDWTNAPPGTMSFAVFFRDLTIDFEHSAIFDIPADLDGLPANVDTTAMPADVPGATQPRSYANTFGYAGPCPGSAHTYEFTLYAIDVANLAELDQNSSLVEVQTVLDQHALASATLSGVFTPP